MWLKLSHPEIREPESIELKALASSKVENGFERLNPYLLCMPEGAKFRTTGLAVRLECSNQSQQTIISVLRSRA